MLVTRFFGFQLKFLNIGLANFFRSVYVMVFGRRAFVLFISSLAISHYILNVSHRFFQARDHKRTMEHSIFICYVRMSVYMCFPHLTLRYAENIECWCRVYVVCIDGAVPSEYVPTYMYKQPPSWNEHRIQNAVHNSQQYTPTQKFTRAHTHKLGRKMFARRKAKKKKSQCDSESRVEAEAASIQLTL